MKFIAVLAAAALAEEEMCRSWAEAGECASNPSYMAKHCAAACRQAKATGKTRSGMRQQMEKECAGYAQAGECSRNPAFMLSTCRKECDAWEERTGLKIDRDSRCVEWSLLGRCESQDLAALCNTSCTVQIRCARSTYSGWSVGVCDKALRCEASDKSSGCAARAARGECRSDATRMAQDCLQSCAASDVDSVLSAHRPEARAVLSSRIDVSSREARSHERCWLPGWAGQNTYKLMLPTQCAAARSLPWQRRVVPPQRRRDGRGADALTCPVDVSRSTPRVRRRSVSLTAPPHPHLGLLESYGGKIAPPPHEVRVVQVLASPRVRLLHDFVTAAEAAEILRLSESHFHRSPVRSVAQDRRTSSTATLAGRNWAVDAIRARISYFSGYDDPMLEPLQVVRYHPGEKYEAHHDLFDLCDFPQKPRRHLTFLIYLSDLPEEDGGHTTFPRLNLRIKPTAFTALVFNDVLDSGMDDERTEHAGTAPLRGVKYAINVWIRAPSASRQRGGLFGRLGF